MNNTNLPFPHRQLRILIQIHILPCINLLHDGSPFGDLYESHLTVLVNYHTADFGVGSFAAGRCFVGIKDEGRAVG